LLLPGSTTRSSAAATGNDILSGGWGSGYDQAAAPEMTSLLEVAAIDTLVGNAGDDRFTDLAADSSVDTLSGGAGRDTFVISMADQALSAAAEDVITDFTAGPTGDIVQLLNASGNPFTTKQLVLKQDGADTVLFYRNNAGQEHSIPAPAECRSAHADAGEFRRLQFPVDFPADVSDSDEGHLINRQAPFDDVVTRQWRQRYDFRHEESDKLAGGYRQTTALYGGIGVDWISGDSGTTPFTRRGRRYLVRAAPARTSSMAATTEIA